MLLYKMDKSVGHSLFKYIDPNAVQLWLNLYTWPKHVRYGSVRGCEYLTVNKVKFFETSLGFLSRNGLIS